MNEPYAVGLAELLARDLPTDEPEPYDLAAARRYVDPRSLPARFHHLKAAGECGAKCLHAFQGDGADTLAKRIGSGAHAMLFDRPFAVWRQRAKQNPKKIAPRSGAAWKAFQAEHIGAVIMTVAEHAHAERIYDAVHLNSKAGPLLFGPGMVYETPIIWSELGRGRQSTPDARGPSHNVELKTTRCAAPLVFARDAERMSYHAQLADQRAAIAYERQGRAPRESYIVAVENRPPYIVQVYELPAALLELGDKLRRIWLEKLQVYEASNMWGGYSQRIETLEFPERKGPHIPDPEWSAEPEPEEH